MRQLFLLEHTMKDIKPLLDESSSHHNHLCPRQILGVRIGLAGASALGLEPKLPGKRLLVIIESDGCFADGVIAATGCTVGHRTLRVEDYGKVAATFVATRTGQAVRVAPVSGVRQLACSYIPEEARHYFAQMQAYQTLPDEKLFTFEDVQLTTPIEQIVSRPGVRIDCASCGEEIINEREIFLEGKPHCIPCAGGGYYRTVARMESLVTEGSPEKVTVMG
jgi:formylmethanofuran dehydrogenase subunit E